MKPIKTLGVTAAVGAAMTGWALRENRRLVTVGHILEHPALPEAFSGLRVVHLSDLHAASFGGDQQRLLEAIDNTEADLVLITGDLIDRRRTVTQQDMRPALLLLQELSRRVPTIRVDGNHEVLSGVGKRFAQLADRTGVQNVTGRGLTVRKGEDHIVILGIPDIASLAYDKDAWKREMHTVCAPYASSFCVALAHRPQFLEDYAEERLPFVLCGHAHGGQVRLPGVGGLYAPEQGVFPKYTAGKHACGDTQMIVSRGLGNSGFPLRFHNPPEIGVITLRRAK